MGHRGVAECGCCLLADDVFFRKYHITHTVSPVACSLPDTSWNGIQEHTILF